MIWQCWVSVFLAIAIAFTTTVSPASALTWNDIRGGNGEMAVSIVNVGQGNCTVIGCANGKKILADCGSSAYGNADKDKAKDYIKSFLNGGSFHAVSVSHGDKDHYSLVPEVAPASSPGLQHVFLPKSDSNPYDYNTGFQTWLKDIDKKGILRSLDQSYYDKADSPNSQLSCSGGTSDSGAYVLGANLGGGGFNSNNNSIVLFLRLSQKSTDDPFTVMLPGDAETAIADDILKRYKTTGFLYTDVLLAGHHGAEEGINNNKSFLDKTKPKVAVFSSSKNNFYHPRAKTVDTLENSGYIYNNAEDHDLTYGNKSGAEWLTDEDTNYAEMGTIDSETIVALSKKGYIEVYSCPNYDPAKCKQLFK